MRIGPRLDPSVNLAMVLACCCCCCVGGFGLSEASPNLPTSYPRQAWCIPGRHTHTEPTLPNSPNADQLTPDGRLGLGSMGSRSTSDPHPAGPAQSTRSWLFGAPKFPGNVSTQYQRCVCAQFPNSSALSLSLFACLTYSTYTTPNAHTHDRTEQNRHDGRSQDSVRTSADTAICCAPWTDS